MYGPGLVLACFSCLVPWAVASSPKPLLTLNAEGHTDRVTRVLFTPDGRKVITVSADKSIRLWDVATGEPAGVLRLPAGPGRQGMLFAAALAPDGTTLAVGGYPVDGEDQGHPIYLLRLPAGPVLRVLRGHGDAIQALAFSADGHWLASGSDDRTVRLWDVATGTSTFTLRGHKDSVYAVAFAADGQRLASASADGSVRLWVPGEGRSLAVLNGHKGAVRCLAWRPDSQVVASGGLDRSIFLWDRDGGRRRHFPNLAAEITSLTFSNNGQRLLATRGLGESKVCSLLNPDSGQEEVRFSRHENSVRSGTLSADGTLAATSGGDAHETYLWKTQDATLVRTLKGKGRRVLAVAWKAEGQTIAWGHVARVGPASSRPGTSRPAGSRPHEEEPASLPA